MFHPASSNKASENLKIFLGHSANAWLDYKPFCPARIKCDDFSLGKLFLVCHNGQGVEMCGPIKPLYTILRGPVVEDKLKILTSKGAKNSGWFYEHRQQRLSM